MTPREIKRKIKEKGLSQRKLARRLRRSLTAINFLINGQLKSEKLETRLARELGITREELTGKGAA